MRRVGALVILGCMLWSTVQSDAAELKCYQVRHTKEVYEKVDHFIQRQSNDIQHWLYTKQKQNPNMPYWFQRVVVANCFDHPELSLSQSAEHVLNRWLNTRMIMDRQ